MNNFLAWLNSHKLSAHITFAGLVSVFGTLFGLYNENPAVKAAFQKLNSELPGWAEAIATILVAFLMWYWKTSKPVMLQAGGATVPIPPGATVNISSGATILTPNITPAVEIPPSTVTTKETA